MELANILEFTRQVAAQWLFLVGGGLMSGLIWALETWRAGRSVRKRKGRRPSRSYSALEVSAIVAPTAFSILLACALAWIGEHEANKAATKSAGESEQKLAACEDTSNPKLSVDMPTVISGDSVEEHGASVFVLASIANTGAPTVLRNWKIEIDANDVKFFGDAQYIPDPFTIYDETGKAVAVFRGSEALSEKVSTKPLDRGGAVVGWLKFRFQGVQAEALRSSKTKYSLTFSDIYGRTYNAWKMFDDSLGGGMEQCLRFYVPGSDQPFWRARQ